MFKQKSVGKKFEDYCEDEKDEYYNLVDHTPTTFLFRYMSKLGIKTPYKNKTHEGQVDTSYAIPGEINYADGHQAIGVFTACIAQNGPGCGICYHWGFNKKPNNTLITEYMQKGRWDFGKIHNQPEDHSCLVLGRTDDGGKLASETPGTVNIDDPLNESTITLYKMK